MATISIIVPCRNEQNTIQLLLKSLYQHSYPRSQIQVVIADGLSSDHTRQRITEFSKEHPDLCVIVVDNSKGNIPAGLNRALAASTGEIIIRLDAHSVPNADYIARCVKALENGFGDNVGGVWEILPGGTSWQARAIAIAAAHPFGVGDAWYRYSDRAQLVDTVPFGAFRRELYEKIGAFDETLLTNEDYEFNTRIRQSGGKVWLDPAIRSVYFARSSFADLIRQYWRYGFWKARMLRNYPDAIRWRQILPPAFVISLLLLPLISLLWPYAAWLFVIEFTTYFIVLLVVGIRSAISKRDILLIFGVPLAIGMMHLTWGSAFLWSLIFR
jgi:succinoglycan biosynthesis protein ExoA